MLQKGLRMDKLVNIIGLSPSEMSSDEYIEKILKPERDRVRQALADFAAAKTPSRGKKAASKSKGAQKITQKELKQLMKEFNMTAEEIQEVIRQERGGEDGGGESL